MVEDQISSDNDADLTVVDVESSVTSANSTGQTNATDTISLDDTGVEQFREILFHNDRQRIREMQAALFELEHRTTDEDALITSITPVLGDIIRTNIETNRDEMIEALYPIIGKLVRRAVTESMRELAHNVDEQMRRALNFQEVWYRWQVRIRGGSVSETTMRHSLPYSLREVFLIQRQSGLLIWHTAPDSESEIDDSDVVGSMLTAIRDFAEDAFGNEEDGHLDVVQYGGLRILVEPAQHIYAAVVIDGTEPAGFRDYLRSNVINIDQANVRVLRQYDGDATPLQPAGEELGTALTQFAGAKTKPIRQERPEQRKGCSLSTIDLVFYSAAFSFVIVLLGILLGLWLWLTGSFG